MSSANRSLEFVMDFVGVGNEAKKEYLDIQREIAANFMAEPDYESSGRQRSPYSYGYVYRPSRRNIILKDPETHRIVMTYASKLMLALFSDPRGEYVHAQPTGYEDAPQKAPTVTRLMRYAFSRPGVYRSLFEAMVDLVQFGTSILELNWKYCTREMEVRDVVELDGQEMSEFNRQDVVIYDDIKLMPIDVADFYYDPSRWRIEDMEGCGKRFRMNAHEARRESEYGLYESAAVEKAIAQSGGSVQRPTDGDPRVDYGHPTQTQAVASFKDMIGYEYEGLVPWIDDDGAARRTITVLNGIVIRDTPYRLADPYSRYHSFIINPVQGRFFGVAPAEIVRHDQSFADAMKILIAEAAIRRVHPPIAFDPTGEPDHAAIRRWDADALIAVRGGPNSIGTLRYDADINSAFAMLNSLKTDMQESSGALGSVSGDPGPDREAASVGVRRLQLGMDRIEMSAALLERESLPMLAQGILRRYQQFLDTEGLRKRVGEVPDPIWIGDIMGEFDIIFSGSRQAMTRSQRLQAWRELTSMASANPAFAAMIPWAQVAQRIIGDDLELPDVAALVGSPEAIVANTQLQQLMGQGGPGMNQVPPAQAAPSMAEGAGGEL